MKKVYYQMIFHQESPLHIGNGMHDDTDSDLLLDGRGLPFIPGTSLAGIIRHRAEESCNNRETIKRLFGIVEKPQKKGDDALAVSSSILIGDAVLKGGKTAEKVTISRRDGVGLNEWGTARRGAKYDFQISQTDEEYYSVIEWSGSDDQYEEEILGLIDPIFKNYVSVGLFAGAKTTRGYGHLNVNVKKRVYEFPKDINEWLEFNPYDLDDFVGDPMDGVQSKSEDVIDISFSMTSEFSVRVKTSKVELMEDGTVPDMIPMENHKGNPVIPGTTWAGVFRHHMHGILRDCGVLENSEEMKKIDDSFGFLVDDSSGSPRYKPVRKSSVSFSESEIEIKDKKNQKVTTMRTALDRFTAAPRTSALFTSTVYVGGTGNLRIIIEKSLPDKLRQLLAFCICDMNIGLLTVGGEASVGRGLMKVNSVLVNGIDKTDQMKASQRGEKAMDWLKGDDDNAKRMEA